MEKIFIKDPKEHLARKGEVYELHFDILSLPFVDEFQKKIIIAQVNNNPLYKITEIENPRGELIITVVIVENPFPLALAIGAVTTVLAGFFIWGSLNKVFQIIESPQGKTVAIGTTVGIIGGVIGLIAMLLKR